MCIQWMKFLSLAKKSFGLSEMCFSESKPPMNWQHPSPTGSSTTSMIACFHSSAAFQKLYASLAGKKRAKNTFKRRRIRIPSTSAFVRDGEISE